MTALFGGYIADPESGHFISERHRAVAGIIQDWNPNLQLVWLPPDVRVAGDENKEFAVILTDPEHYKQEVVCYASPDEVDERLVARLYEMDTKRTDVLSRLEYDERARRLLEARIEMERAEERAEITTSVLASNLHTYKLPNGRVIRS